MSYLFDDIWGWELILISSTKKNDDEFDDDEFDDDEFDDEFDD